MAPPPLGGAHSAALTSMLVPDRGLGVSRGTVQASRKGTGLSATLAFVRNTVNLVPGPTKKNLCMAYG